MGDIDMPPEEQTPSEQVSPSQQSSWLMQPWPDVWHTQAPPAPQIMVPQQSADVAHCCAAPGLRQQVSEPVDSSVSHTALPQHMLESLQLEPIAEPPVQEPPLPMVVPQTCVDVSQLRLQQSVFCRQAPPSALHAHLPLTQSSSPQQSRSPPGQDAPVETQQVFTSPLPVSVIWH
jgi:hypothetical protein